MNDDEENGEVRLGDRQEAKRPDEELEITREFVALFYSEVHQNLASPIKSVPS